MSKRKQAEKILYDVLNIMDSSGTNTEAYKKKFSKMSDKEFDAYMTKFLKDPTQQFYLEIEPFEKEAGIRDIKKAADYLKVPLEEYVYMPYASEGDTHIRTAQPVPVGYIHIKRMQQLLSKKNTFSTDISQRQAKTGQRLFHIEICVNISLTVWEVL